MPAIPFAASTATTSGRREGTGTSSRRNSAYWASTSRLPTLPATPANSGTPSRIMDAISASPVSVLTGAAPARHSLIPL